MSYGKIANADWCFGPKVSTGSPASFNSIIFDNPNDTLLGVVFNFVFLEIWPPSTYLRRLMEDERIYLTFGIHPRSSHVIGVEDLRELKDYTSQPPCSWPWGYQPGFYRGFQEFLRQMLSLALKYDLPVVVQSRFQGDFRATSTSCLEIHKQVLPPGCCLGGSGRVESRFPNVVFSVAGTILKRTSHPSFVV